MRKQKTEQQKRRLQEIKEAKADHKLAMRNKVIFRERRDALIHQMLKSEAPNWGSLKIQLLPIK